LNNIKQVIRKIIEDVLVHRTPDKQCSVSQLITLVNEEHGITLGNEEVVKIIQDTKFKDNFNWFYDLMHDQVFLLQESVELIARADPTEGTPHRRRAYLPLRPAAAASRFPFRAWEREKKQKNVIINKKD